MTVMRIITTTIIAGEPCITVPPRLVLERGACMKKLSNLMFALALLLSHAMCAVVAYEYRGMLCCIAHALCSAPASVAFVYVVPFAIGIVICVFLGYHFRRK